MESTQNHEASEDITGGGNGGNRDSTTRNIIQREGNVAQKNKRNQKHVNKTNNTYTFFFPSSLRPFLATIQSPRIPCFVTENALASWRTGFK